MTLLILTLATATLLCSLVAGLLLTFAIIVMPGIAKLGDRDFLRAFKHMDGIIQSNQPLFILVWLGSVAVLGAACIMGFFQLQGIDQFLILLATSNYFIGVQLITFTKNVPLNNRLQRLDLGDSQNADTADLRKEFLHTWVPCNSIRTLFAVLTATLLITLLIRI